MEIFPYVLLRIGGGSFENLETLNISIDKNYEEIYKKKQILKNEVSEFLFKDISKINDRKRLNLLLNIKRDLFNERNFENIKISEIAVLTEKITLDKIYEYINIVKEVEKYSKEIVKKYEDELTGLREKLKELSQDRSIQNGFVFSSQSLYKNIQEYLKHTGEYTKSIKKTEVSIIKYLTRTFAKTSPFSSFNNLGMGKLSDDMGNEFLQKNDKDEFKIKSDIRLNNSIFAYVRNCIFKLKELYINFYITANPTITIQGKNYRYLINFNNVESFQKVGINPIVEYFLSIVKENGRIKYCDFIKKVLEDEMLDASEGEIDAYIYQLIELGFFEFDINISGLDTGWLEKLIEYLSSLQTESESKDIIFSTLSFFKNLIPVFEKADISDRLEISNKACEKFKEMKKHLDGLLKPPDEKDNKKEEKAADKKDDNSKNIDEKKENEKDEEIKKEVKRIIKNVQYYEYDLKPETIFYEDTTVDGEFKINDLIIKDIITDFQKLLSYFSSFEMRKDEQDSMVHFFKKKYKEDDYVNMLTFYEEYISDKKEKKKQKEKEEKEKKEKEEREKKEKEEKKEENKNENIKKVDEITKEEDNNKEDKQEEIIPEIQRRIDLRKKFFDNVINILSEKNHLNNDVIEINDEILDDAYKNTGMKNKIMKTSTGFFIQFFHDYNAKGEKKIKAMINSSFPGYGKMTSRFLHLFPDEFTEETCNWNEKYSKETLLAEDIDSGIMNFNLHPALMPYEISVPGGNFVLDIEKRILISELIIKYDKNENTLQLFDNKRGKIVYAFDLGFQGYGGRSELFKFLISFTLPGLVFVYPLVNKIYELFKPLNLLYNGNKGEVTILPRIVYKDYIVVSRKGWIIPKTLIPFKNQTEKESEYFARIQKWRFDLGIPEEVFLRLNTNVQEGEEKNKAKKKLSRDDRKPQYINFGNPFLVRLFEKHLDKVTDAIRISEMLPESDGMIKIYNAKYVSEFVVQYYNY
jgi:hypothetical protein